MRHRSLRRLRHQALGVTGKEARPGENPQTAVHREPELRIHHHVYVVLLKDQARRLRSVRAANPQADPAKPCVYVGMTGLNPEDRFANHRAGIKAAPVVRRFGVRLLPQLYAHLNPMPYAEALRMEQDLAEDLRREGYTVAGGH